ncbi:hypothetical protein F0726_01876 [Acidithiobacillus caldus]|nr:hypothetical protein F0726_01876 [Acidithiobacillus caldus]
MNEIHSTYLESTEKQDLQPYGKREDVVMHHLYSAHDTTPF